MLKENIGVVLLISYHWYIAMWWHQCEKEERTLQKTENMLQNNSLWLYKGTL